MKKTICTALLLCLFPSLAQAEGYYYHYDHLGGVDTVTDEEGEVVAEYEYYPFGEVYEETIYDENFSNNYKFTGQESDGETNLYYYKARYYGTEVGRFMSQDPAVYDERVFEMLEDPQSLNTYAYVRNNPILYVDPTGEYKVKTGEIEKGDTITSITQAVNDALGINVSWKDIATVSFFEENFGTTDPTRLIGEYTYVGTNHVTDITDELDALNYSFAMESIENDYGILSLGWKYFPGHVWDLKSSEDPIFGAPDSTRQYYAYIYKHNLIRYDAPGNINFGYVWNAVGKNLKSALWGANLVQKGFADDGYDQDMIQWGYNLAD